MKNLVLLGGSIASLKAVELLRTKEIIPERIVLLSANRHPVVDRSRYTEGIIRQLKPRQLAYFDEAFLVNHEIESITDKTVTRVNVTRKKIHFNDRSQLDYDTLIIADTPQHKFGPIKGSNKDGVFGYRNIEHMQQIGTLAALNDGIAIESDQWWGLDLALQLGQKKKEVLLSLSSQHPMVRQTDQGYQEALIKMLHERSVNLLIDNPLEEILGDGDVKAIKVKSGKVYASQLVVLEDSRADLRIFSEGLDCDGGRILVDEQFCSNIEDVYAVDHLACRSLPLWEGYGLQPALLEYEAQAVANRLTENSTPLELPLPGMSLQEGEFSVVAAGQIVEGRAVSSQSQTDSQTGRLIRVFSKDDKVIGILGVNAGIPHAQAMAAIQEQQSATTVWEDYATSTQQLDAAPGGDLLPAPDSEEGVSLVQAPVDPNSIPQEQ